MTATQVAIAHRELAGPWRINPWQRGDRRDDARAVLTADEYGVAGSAGGSLPGAAASIGATGYDCHFLLNAQSGLVP